VRPALDFASARPRPPLAGGDPRREAIEVHLPALVEADFGLLQDAIASR